MVVNHSPKKTDTPVEGAGDTGTSATSNPREVEFVTPRGQSPTGTPGVTPPCSLTGSRGRDTLQSPTVLERAAAWREQLEAEQRRLAEAEQAAERERQRLAEVERQTEAERQRLKGEYAEFEEYTRQLTPQGTMVTTDQAGDHHPTQTLWEGLYGIPTTQLREMLVTLNANPLGSYEVIMDRLRRAIQRNVDPFVEWTEVNQPTPRIIGAEIPGTSRAGDWEYPRTLRRRQLRRRPRQPPER